ncbi:MAG: hypothetical protein JKX74_06735 [Flavobacteriales bacterium]|nr:hypothetical protein [Flavobacteriales bacterium]
MAKSSVMCFRIKRFHITLFLVFGIGLSSVLTVSAQSDSTAGRKFSDIFQARGYVKNLQTAAFLGFDDVITQNFLHARINTRTYLTNSLTIGAELRSRIFYGEFIKAMPGFGDALEYDPGYWDFSSSLVNEDAFVLHAVFDRLWLNWASDKWDVRIGRQRINWGVNLVWNPNDLFNTYNFVDFDYDERPGSDGIRVTRYLKGMSSVEVGAKFSKNPDSTVVAGLFKFNKWGYDLQVLSGIYYEDIALGLGWAGNLKTAGLKGEATYFHPRSNAEDTTGLLSTAVTIDYSFKAPLYITGAVLYNSGGTSAPLSLTQAFSLGSDLTAKNLMPTRFSYFLQLNGTIKSLTTVSLAGIYGAGMNLMFLMPSATYAISETWDIMLLAQLAYVDFQDDFTNAANMLFIRTKWSF